MARKYLVLAELMIADLPHQNLAVSGAVSSRYVIKPEPRCHLRVANILGGCKRQGYWSKCMDLISILACSIVSQLELDRHRGSHSYTKRRLFQSRRITTPHQKRYISCRPFRDWRFEADKDRFWADMIDFQGEIGSVKQSTSIGILYLSSCGRCHLIARSLEIVLGCPEKQTRRQALYDLMEQIDGSSL